MSKRIVHRLMGAAALGLNLGVGGCSLPPPSDGSPEVALETVASGLTAPVFVTHAGDGSGRLFVVDQIGLIRLIDSSKVLLSTAFLDIRDHLPALTAVGDERGLLGLAFHPSYENNGRFFVAYNTVGTSALRLCEFTVSSDRNLADRSSERLLIEIEKPQNNHNGGQLAFGPDGFLYMGVGDGGGANDVATGHTPDLGNAQDRSRLLGKILRIDVNQGTPYGVPADNPFVSTSGAAPEVFAYGLRNPWRFSFDGSRLIVADVGQNNLEEVNLVEKGDNLGWNLREGNACFDPSDVAPSGCVTALDGAPLEDPVITYPHSGEKIGGLAVIGGYVYRGEDLTGFNGLYIFGDYSSSFVTPSGRLFVATESTDRPWSVDEIAVANRDSRRLDRYLLSFGTDEAGEIYVCASSAAGPSGNTGVVYKLVSPDP